MKKIVCLISIVSFLFCLTSCDKTTSPDNIPFTGSINGDSTVLLMVNDTFRIRITPADASVTYAINVDNTYKSPRQGVISVSADGRVKALEAGKVSVSVKNNAGQFNFSVVVVALPGSVLLKDTAVLIKTGRSSQAVLDHVYDQYEQKMLGGITWEMLNSNLATVSGSGEITALKEGETKLRVHVKNYPAVYSDYTVRILDYFVYVLGDCLNDLNYVRNCYWKNDLAVASDLYKTSFIASGILFSNNNIYKVGTSTVPQRAYMLKNATETLFSESGAGATGVAMMGDDVYTAGFYTASGTKTVALWKNNALSPILTQTEINSESIGTTIAVSAGDTYVGGYIKNSQNIQVACYWKNKQRVDLSDGTANAIVNSVFVDGADVYAAGNYAGVVGGFVYSIACYWKNGVKTDLINAGSDARSISLSQGDIYIAGNYLTSNAPTACYWKNGIKVDLVTGAGVKWSTTSSMKIADNNVFISGFYQNNNDKYIGCYWKNGIRVDLKPTKFINGTDVEIYQYSSTNDLAIE